MALPPACCSVLPIMTAGTGPTPPPILIRTGEVCFVAGLAGLLVIAFGSMWVQWSQRRLAEPRGWPAGACVLISVVLVAGVGLVTPSLWAAGAAIMAGAAGGTGWGLDRRWCPVLKAVCTVTAGSQI
jgi:hypothetical protein